MTIQLERTWKCGRAARYVARLLFHALAAVPAVASAASFSLNPTRIELGPQRHVDILTLRNSGTAPLRMQVRTMHWSMTSDGRWHLTPSNDLIVTPELIEIAPGTSGQLRVGSLLDAGVTEASYRLLINELPNLSDKNGVRQIQVLSEVSLPVFIEPANPSRIPVIRSAQIEHGALQIAIGDDGSQRLDPQSVKLAIRNHSDKAIEQRETMVNYVLPGATLPLRVELSSAICKQAATISLSWPGITGTPVSHSIATGAEACEGKNSH